MERIQKNKERRRHTPSFFRPPSTTLLPHPPSRLRPLIPSQLPQTWPAVKVCSGVLFPPTTPHTSSPFPVPSVTALPLDPPATHVETFSYPSYTTIFSTDPEKRHRVWNTIVIVGMDQFQSSIVRSSVSSSPVSSCTVSVFRSQWPVTSGQCSDQCSVFCSL